MTWRIRLLSVLLSGLLSACAGLGFRDAAFGRPFRFETDSIGFANELVWGYGFDAEGTWRASERIPESDYTHRCFVLARSARQFFQHARFDPSLPRPDDTELRERVRRVVETSPRRWIAEEERIVIPGFANLRELSRAREPLLKSELGGAVWSYIELGNWRMVMPLTRRHQARTAEELIEAIDAHRPPVVHLVRFPDIRINHAMLLFAYTESDAEIVFSTYDPNAPDAPVRLAYDRNTRTFALDRNTYFLGGRVDVYEIYHRPGY